MGYRLKAMFKYGRVGLLFVVVYVVYIRYTAGQCVCETDSIDIKNRQQIISLGQDDEDAFIFVHISDLHISHYTANDRYEQLNEFCSVNLKAIGPGLVLASGDLTDSVAPGKVLVKQFLDEWQMYKDVYTKCQNESGMVHWLDLRGNHDNFNVDGYNSSNSYYPQFGSQRKNPGSYMTIIKTNERTKYAFIAVDATLEIGPKRLLNFVGQLDDNRLSKLKEFDKNATNSNVNGTIWFGHYPSSCIFNSGPGLRDVASKGIAYLCGHLHNFVGFVPEMYSRHYSGMLELELADWKDNRIYRVAVLDKGLFSFADVKHKTWPIIVVSNPKPLLTVQCCQQPIEIMATSTHIRIFIFSPSPIEVCEVSLDHGSWKPCKLTGQNNPLYTAPWQPELYAEGRHTLEVRAKDSSGSEETTEIEFALDKTISPHFSWRAEIALMWDLTTISRWLFWVSIFFSTVPFGIMHLLQRRITLGERSPERVKCACLKLLLRKFWVFSGIKKLFYPILAYSIYLCVGPWLAGYLIDDRIGVVFAWGTFFDDGLFLKGTTTYLYCGIHIILFNGPLICILAHTADVRFEETIKRNRAYSRTFFTKFMLHVPIWSLLAFHLATCLLFMHSYGWYTLLLNPARFWSLFLAFYLWWKAKTLNSLDFKNIAKTWN
ncbi:transmembrane protein 62-like isoform X2 [Daphnia pulex]|uniref:transmembrane protein 62-like isoform X2 n=1 Tax=Daphnia pulex TaxID=6669 RepID=UPI001EDD472C|nr:transmembrane protein 62-like isoform X2 [Daphnia pulex]